MGNKVKRATQKAIPIEDQKDWKINVQPKTPGQRQYIQTISKNEITLCEGPAGTGKTLIAIGIALQEVLAKKYDRVILLRPIKEACDEHVGYLPGDLDQKMAVWTAPVVDNLLFFVNKHIIKKLFLEEKIEVIPLAFARGRSLNKCFIILDEAQNCSAEQLKMVLTRIGESSKMVINGDNTQNDTKLKVTGLRDAMSRLDDFKGIGICEMDKTDIVRNPLISGILERYDPDYNTNESYLSKILD